jgi:hypothetical protein
MTEPREGLNKYNVDTVTKRKTHFKMVLAMIYYTLDY